MSHMSKNHVEQWGNLAKDPESGRTGSGTAVANFTVVTISTHMRGDLEHEESTFVPVECFGGLATYVLDNFRAGARVVVEGRLKNVNWMSGSEKKSKMLISATRVLAIR